MKTLRQCRINKSQIQHMCNNDDGIHDGVNTQYRVQQRISNNCNKTNGIFKDLIIVQVLKFCFCQEFVIFDKKWSSISATLQQTTFCHIIYTYTTYMNIEYSRIFVTSRLWYIKFLLLQRNSPRQLCLRFSSLALI